MEEFEDYDVQKEEAGEIEKFDVKQPEVEIPITIEATGGLCKSEDEFKSLLEAQDELEKKLMPELSVKAAAAAEDGVAGFGNIVAVGIGEKTVRGVPIGQLVVKVLVKEKVKATRVSSEALVPESVGGVRTDVEESGEIYACFYIARRRPAPGGVSIGNCWRPTFGTLGCLVTRANQLFILSNNHVIAVVNTSPLNAAICQPSPLDGGVCPRDIIARLTQFVRINFTGVNFVDAAIARTSSALVDRRILRPGNVLQPLVAPVVDPAVNMQVQKSGRTTQYRRGIIDHINTTVDVTFPSFGVARFERQFRVRGISNIFGDVGDSGSLVTTFHQNQPVGLLFAVNVAANMTFCNPIRTVLNALSVNIVF